MQKEFFKKIPGYNVINDTIQHFTGGKEVPFSSVVLVKPFNNDTLMTGFITEKHTEYYTVFIPTGPNPTSGNIMHLKPKNIIEVDIPLEDAMKSIIGCGAGSSKIFKNYTKKHT